jgi:hypothetical protein
LVISALPLEELHQSLMKLSMPQVLDHPDRLTCHRVDAGLSHARGDVIA